MRQGDDRPSACLGAIDFRQQCACYCLLCTQEKRDDHDMIGPDIAANSLSIN